MCIRDRPSGAGPSGRAARASGGTSTTRASPAPTRPRRRGTPSSPLPWMSPQPYCGSCASTRAPLWSG
eukprot:2793097-Lingulodinium_polyedra.AAC.1